MTSYDVEQILDRVNTRVTQGVFLYVFGAVLLFGVVLLIIAAFIALTTDNKQLVIPVLLFGILFVFILAIALRSLQFDKLQDLSRLQENNINFCYKNSSIALDDIKQSASNSNNAYCKNWIEYTNFYWDNSSVRITTDDPEVDKMLDSCTETPNTEQPVSNISN